MLSNLGPTIRHLRISKGVSLNEFAEELNVSPGYLSNLETGKTDTITLKTLSQLDEVFNLFPKQEQDFYMEHELQLRLNRLFTKLLNIYDSNPKLVDYFLDHIEKGIEFYEGE